MRLNRVVCLLALGACLGFAQTPDLSGVWKADLDKSSQGGPRPSSYILVLDQKPASLTEIAEIVNQRGPYRSTSTYNLSGQESRDYVRGIPGRSKAVWDNGSLVVDTKIFNTKPEAQHKKYTLSSDGKTLTLESSGTMNGREMQSKVVFEKQPAEAGDALRKPEQTAAGHYKNVLVLKEVPASRFIDLMHYFSMAVGGNCESCHVKGDFASDDKKEKATARLMIAMTTGINQQHFGGKPEVRCFTCHHGSQRPQSAPVPQP
ncbi:MAG: c-type cytochrome [Acidobacteria bacterium]|nr:c-type cytochrome [Acidobacteriota bacterium]